MGFGRDAGLSPITSVSTMGAEVYANGNAIACKAGDGKVIAAFPDVCLSPPSPPVGPVPIPYPDTSFSKDMQNGSKTVSIGGQEVMLKDQSFYQTSPLGDEAATKGLGAGVITHVITGKTYFVAWSMDVQFEGQNVDRHIDLTTSNHASPQGNEGAPIPNGDKQSEDCPHKNIKRDPEKGEHPINQEARKEHFQKTVDKREAHIDRMLAKAAAAESAGDAAGAAMHLDAALEYEKEDGNKLAGDRIEAKVAEDENAKEIKVTIKCRDCGKILGEFDVVTEDGVVKECKASWRDVDSQQFHDETALAQRPDVFGPGTVVHLALPKGQRPRLDRQQKFKKEEIAGKIQEH
jgi:hypothetical protein